MLLLSCSKLSRGFDEGPLFTDIGFELFAGDRVGLVGPNGVGKTTLLRLLASQDRPDDGEVRLHAGARAALLRQQPIFEPGRTLLVEARSALDEPTNHPDIATTRWLEEYLVKEQEAMLRVSHDRYFLDRVVTKIFELNAQHLTAYPGNYQAYARQRHERYEHQLKAWEAQQEYVAKQEDYIRRVHYGQLHKQAQSRQKALERLERMERPTLGEIPPRHFGHLPRPGDIV